MTELLPADGAMAGTEGFWFERQTVNREVSLPLGRERLEEAGSLENFRRAAEGKGSHRGQLFNDSDVYKWLEAVAWEQGRLPSLELALWQRKTSALVAEAQCPDGYLNTYFQLTGGVEDRFSDMAFGHELYCAGHLMQAAVAQQRATGDGPLVPVATRLGSYLVDVFGPGRREAVPGHPEIEMALVELCRLTGTEAYRDLAHYFVEGRGSRSLSSSRYGPVYFQDHVALRAASTVEGHAVRAIYLQCGATDVSAETSDERLRLALLTQWESMTTTKLYLTGGLGARGEGECFGDPYELPPDSAYCESCASIASVMWNWRMLLLTGEARFADLIERTMYNGVLAGVSLDGSRFAYVNPLQARTAGEHVSKRIPVAGRNKWFETACCPANLMRMISSWGRYAVTRSSAGLALQQFVAGTFVSSIPGGTAQLRVATSYPHSGEIAVEVVSAPGSQWELAVRVPAWCEDTSITVNGQPGGDGPSGGYLRVLHAWKPGDTVVVDLAMPVRRTRPHPRVDAVRGCVALERGPLVYCFEQTDLPPGRDLDDMVLLDRPITFHRSSTGGLGLDWLQTSGSTNGPQTTLYRSGDTAAPATSSIDLIAVPYHAWGNREPGAMRVWLPEHSSSNQP